MATTMPTAQAQHPHGKGGVGGGGSTGGSGGGVGTQWFQTVQLAPPDAIFHMNAACKADTDPHKIDVGVGAYRDDQGQPWVLPVVRKAERKILEDTKLNHEYLPIEGLKAFTDGAAQLILGADHPALKEGRSRTVQTISGTGACRLGAGFLAHIKKGARVLLSNPTWGNHKAIFLDAGFTDVAEYTYYHPATRGLDLEGMLRDLNAAPKGSIVVLHACAHNPTGVDPTSAQWQTIAETMAAREHFVFFDCAYQGFASGDVDRDAWAVRYFASRGELIVAQSFAKNMGLYNERTGALTVVARTGNEAEAVRSHWSRLTRASISNPPAFGARVAATILTDPALYAEWLENLKTMAHRIQHMREALVQHLHQLKTPGSWQHVIDQIGMFSFTGLNKTQSQAMTSQFHIYMTDNGRISMAGLNSKNVEYFAKSIDQVVRTVQ